MLTALSITAVTAFTAVITAYLPTGSVAQTITEAMRVSLTPVFAPLTHAARMPSAHHLICQTTLMAMVWPKHAMEDIPAPAQSAIPVMTRAVLVAIK